MLNMVANSSQCLETRGARERAWSEGQADSLEKSRGREVATFCGCEAQSADGRCVQVRDETQTYSLVPPKAVEYWASKGHNLRMSFEGGKRLYVVAVSNDGLG